VTKLYGDSKHYRERAEECRVLAEILATVELRDKMLKIAADYERMAEAADKLKDDSADVRRFPSRI
jgi:hypothetical protein